MHAGAIVTRQILDEILHHGKRSSWFTNRAVWDYFSAVIFLWSSMVLLKKIAQQEKFSEICQNTACLPQKDRNTLFSYIASLSSLVGPNNVASEQPTSRGIWNGMRRLAEQAFIRRTERLMLIPKPRFGLHLHWSNVSSPVKITSDGWHFFIATFSDGRFVLKTLTGREPSPKTPRWCRADT